MGVVLLIASANANANANVTLKASSNDSANADAIGSIQDLPPYLPVFCACDTTEVHAFSASASRGALSNRGSAPQLETTISRAEFIPSRAVVTHCRGIFVIYVVYLVGGLGEGFCSLVLRSTPLLIDGKM